MPVATSQRFTRSHPCPVCGGYDRMPRGKGQRCWGFLSEGGLYAHCVRSELAGGLPFNEKSVTYAHRLRGSCKCGVQHGPDMPSETGKQPKQAKPAKQTGSTDYYVKDPDGVLMAIHRRIDRKERKDYLWLSPDGSPGLKGVAVTDLPLYGAETLKGLPDGAVVILTEGEKARNAVVALGFAAVGTVTGAATTPSVEVLRVLSRFRVYLFPDNDEPGHKHMLGIARRLAAMGHKDIAVVFWPDAPSAGDAADFVGDAKAFQALIDTARKYVPEAAVGLQDLLTELEGVYLRYVRLEAHQVTAVILWVLHTWAFEAADATPYLAIGSVEKRSGKTRLLEVMALLVARPWFTGHTSTAALVRKVDKEHPTLLLDETDAAFKGDRDYAEALRGMLNSGYRRGGKVSLCLKGGGDMEVKDYSVFCPKAFAGIGKLPDTVMDRSIPITMKRRRPNETVTRFRERDAEAQLAPLRQRMQLGAEQAIPVLVNARPELPEALNDRAADVWEPLLAIADLAGDMWAQRARAAALALSGGEDAEDESLGPVLLKDIRTVFANSGSDRWGSRELVSFLVHDFEESPWRDLNGKPLDTRILAKMVKPFGVRPHQVRFSDTLTAKGYLASDFHDAFARYLPPMASETHTAGEVCIDLAPDPAAGDVSDVPDVSLPGEPGQVRSLKGGVGPLEKAVIALGGHHRKTPVGKGAQG